MIYRLLADLTVFGHFLFILFTVLGGLLVLRWRWVALLHLPAAAWGVIVQVVVGGVCPLTPLENYFRERGNEPGIGPSFIDHYLTSLIYVDDPPAWFHPVVGVVVLLINGTVYGILIAKWVRRRRAASMAAAQGAEVAASPAPDDADHPLPQHST